MIKFSCRFHKAVLKNKAFHNPGKGCREGRGVSLHCQVLTSGFSLSSAREDGLPNAWSWAGANLCCCHLSSARAQLWGTQHSGLEVGWRTSSPVLSSQPAQVLGKHFTPSNKPCLLKFFFSSSWSAAWELAGRWQGRDSQLLTLAAPCPVTPKGSASSPSL